MNTFNKIARVTGKTKEKLNKYIKSCMGKAVEHKQIVNMMGMALGIVTCSVMLFTLFSPGYEVYLSGEKVAVVENKEDFVKSFEKANDEIEKIAGSGFGIARIPKFIFTVAPKTSISTRDEMVESVMAQSDEISKAFVIEVDGADVATAKDEQAAKDLLEKATSVYGGENRKILNNVEIVEKYVAARSITDQISAVTRLTDVLKVSTEKISVCEAELLYGKVENPTEDLFINEEKISAQGENGVMEVTARVTEVNGKVENTEIISTRVLREPVNEVVMVGTTVALYVGTGVLMQPYVGTITSRFGARWGRTHSGTDISGNVGDAVLAADNGIVITAEYQENGYGNIIIIDHQNDIQTWYAHLDSLDVAAGDVVKKGDKIGGLGNTGYSTGPHLHFEVRENGTPVNPSKYLSGLQ